MTEIDRIIGKGIIDREYLHDEVKNDFLVDENRKKLWAIMLDMIVEFDKVCKKYDLTYYAIYGALLGAVRHKGFIPWDDDFDVAMPREDYERFIRLSDEFRHPYFLQTPYTDSEYFYSFAKIRNSNTTGVVEMFEYSKFNHGIWISVFPLDRWDNDGGEERYYQIRKLVIDCSTFMRMGNPHLDETNKTRVAAYQGDPMRDYEEIQRLAQFCKDPDSEYVMTAVITQGSYPGKLLKAADFERAIPMEFERMEIMVPIGYDHLLRVWYRDYMQFPPIEKRGLCHAGTVFDADIPYKDYLHQQGIDI